jgi:hypothetical protein
VHKLRRARGRLARAARGEGEGHARHVVREATVRATSVVDVIVVVDDVPVVVVVVVVVDVIVVFIFGDAAVTVGGDVVKVVVFLVNVNFVAVIFAAVVI